MRLKIEEDYQYKSVPGRGLVSPSATKARVKYLIEKGFKLEHITRYFLDHGSIQNNIESFIGSVEIPLGIVGPLLFSNGQDLEEVYTAAGTLEGALVASMNRGAKAISLSGGFKAKVEHQKMVRAPLFILTNDQDATIFAEWITIKFEEIKNVAEKYSNHAKLISTTTHSFSNNVHVKFTYTTGDASGQNMTTTCTWHAMLWIVKEFESNTGIVIPDFVIDGNGSSDKKVSRFLLDHGRGTRVKAECFLEEKVIKKVLRTTAADLYKFFSPSKKIAEEDGMIGYNINVANAIAAIFVATGQDLASIHESSLANLELQKQSNGLHFSLTLPSLVVGTVGGGTTLLKQHEGLKIMDCAGNGKAERFARLIAGFALALEISTYSAIVSGEFAKAHERLGRNKPSKWLLRNELNEIFISKCLDGKINGVAIEKVLFPANLLVENGILTTITQRVNRKLTGFVPLNIRLQDGTIQNILIKSKPLDIEVIKGLHLMAASIDPELSDLIYQNRTELEYWNSHLKEISVLQTLNRHEVKTIPHLFGCYTDEDREIYLIFQERFEHNQMIAVNSENSPDLWTVERLQKVIQAITSIHHLFSDPSVQRLLPEVQTFEPWRSAGLYQKMATILIEENEQLDFTNFSKYLTELEQLKKELQIPLTIIHNDFNPRNVALRADELPCIYDWELTVKNIPHRDIIEFLCFALPQDFEETIFKELLEYHYQNRSKIYNELDWDKWKKGYSYSLKEFLVTRAAFYKVSEILMKLKFGDRIIQNGLRMLKLLDNMDNLPLSKSF